MTAQPAFDAREFTVVARGGALLRGEEYFPVGGADESLPTIVLAHGWTLNRTLWGRVIRGIHARRPVRVIAYDQRGHGQSTPGTGHPAVGALGDDLAAVIAVAAPAGPLVLAGHSMGGMTVMAYAGRHRSQLADRVRGVVLLATAAAEVERPGWFGKVETGVMRAAARGPQIPAGIFIVSPHQRHLNFGDHADPRDVRLVRRAIAGTKIRNMAQYFQALGDMDERSSLDALGQVPTSILVGTKDRLTPVPYARALHAGIPGSSLTELAGKGHMLGFEATDIVCDAICAHIPS